MEAEHSRRVKRNKATKLRFFLSRFVIIAVTVLGIAYLAAIPFGKINNDRKFGIVEAILLGIILLFNSGLIQRLEKFVISEKGFEIQLEQIQAKQDQQQLQIKTLEFLMTRFVTERELGHLWGLVLDKSFPYTKSSWFEAELRHLRAAGLIEGNPGVTVADMPAAGDVKDHFYITESGRAYLSYRQQFEQFD
jgi:hypothetical protein